MLKLSISFLLGAFLVLGYAASQEEVKPQSNRQVIDTINKVELIEEKMIDKDGDIYGKGYFAYNPNSFPVYVVIKLTDAENVRNELINVQVTIKPDEVVDLGDVFRDKSTEDADWNYSWTVSRFPF